MSSPLLRRLALTTLISSGSGTSGVSIRSLRPYLCGLSSGSGDGAGMLGDNANSRFVGSGGNCFCWVTSICVSVLESSTKAGWFSNLDSRRLSALESRTMVETLSGLLFSVIVIDEGECTCDLRGEVVEQRCAGGFFVLSSFCSRSSGSNVDVETCCET